MPNSPSQPPRSDAPRGAEVKRQPAFVNDDVFDPLVDGAAQLENRVPSPAENTPAPTTPAVLHPFRDAPGQVHPDDIESHTANWEFNPADENARSRRTPFPDDDAGD